MSTIGNHIHATYNCPRNTLVYHGDHGGGGLFMFVAQQPQHPQGGVLRLFMIQSFRVNQSQGHAISSAPLCVANVQQEN